MTDVQTGLAVQPKPTDLDFGLKGYELQRILIRAGSQQVSTGALNEIGRVLSNRMYIHLRAAVLATKIANRRRVSSNTILLSHRTLTGKNVIGKRHGFKTCGKVFSWKRLSKKDKKKIVAESEAPQPAELAPEALDAAAVLTDDQQDELHEETVFADDS